MGFKALKQEENLVLKKKHGEATFGLHIQLLKTFENIETKNKIKDE